MNFGAIDPGELLIGAVGILIAVIQLFFGFRKEKLDSTENIIARLQAPEATQARFKVRALMKKAEGVGFDGLENEERAVLSSVGSLFGLAGLLLRQGKLDEKLFLDAWAGSIQKNFKELEPFKQYRDAKHDRHSMWRDFEWIAGVAERHIKSATQPASLSATSATEMASLSASCIAAGVALVLVPGAYDHFSVVISITLFLLIVGSLKPRSRNAWERLGIAASLALSLLPLIGFAMEGFLSGHAAEFFAGATPEICSPGAEETYLEGFPEATYECADGTPESKVTSVVQAVMWALTLGTVFPLIDRLAAKRW